MSEIIPIIIFILLCITLARIIYKKNQNKKLENAIAQNKPIPGNIINISDNLTPLEYGIITDTTNTNTVKNLINSGYLADPTKIKYQIHTKNIIRNTNLIAKIDICSQHMMLKSAIQKKNFDYVSFECKPEDILEPKHFSQLSDYLKAKNISIDGAKYIFGNKLYPTLQETLKIEAISKHLPSDIAVIVSQYS